MSRHTLSLALTFIFLLSLGTTALTVQAQEGEESEFHIRGVDVRTIGEYPHSFSYDGSNVGRAEKGFFELHIDPENDQGLMFARIWVDDYQLDAETTLENAELTVIYPLFGTPNQDTMPDYWEGGISTDVLLHGDSGHEAPVLPTVWNKVASWGPSMVFVNGEPYEADPEFMGQENVMNLLSGHMMYSNMVRDPETGFVPSSDPDAPFSPVEPGNGPGYEEDASLLHLVTHTDTRDDDAFPPNTMFVHINFLDVEEIDPIDVEFVSWEQVRDEGMEILGEHVDDWLALVDATEEELYGEDS